MKQIKKIAIIFMAALWLQGLSLDDYEIDMYTNGQRCIYSTVDGFGHRNFLFFLLRTLKNLCILRALLIVL